MSNCEERQRTSFDQQGLNSLWLQVWEVRDWGSWVLHCRALRNDTRCCIGTEFQHSVHRHTAGKWVFSKANAIGPLPSTHLYGKFNIEFQKMQKTLKRLTHFSAGGMCQSLCYNMEGKVISLTAGNIWMTTHSRSLIHIGQMDIWIDDE